MENLLVHTRYKRLVLLPKEFVLVEKGASEMHLFFVFLDYVCFYIVNFSLNFFHI